jgi:hypothetical protein
MRHQKLRFREESGSFSAALQRQQMTSAALGFRTHSGWTAAVAVAGPPQSSVVPAGVPTRVVDRRRIELVDEKTPDSVQPYHAAAEMEFQEAEKWVKRCTDRTHFLARQAIEAFIQELDKKGYRVVAYGVVLASGRALPPLAAILGSHPLIHTAEGELFRNALSDAGKYCGLSVTGVKERELYTRGAAELGVKEDELRHRLTEMGRLFGPPWRQDEKSSTLAAWLALAAAGHRQSNPVERA